MVAFSGHIGFVGLMMPHPVRFAIGGEDSSVLPLSAAARAIFPVVAARVVRLVIAPVTAPVTAPRMTPGDMRPGVVHGWAGAAFLPRPMARGA